MVYFATFFFFFFKQKLCEAMIDRYTRSMRDIDQIDRETIVRVITTVAEIDMKMMKEEYRQKSGRALQDDISDAFLDRQDCLLLILLILNPINAPTRCVMIQSHYMQKIEYRSFKICVVNAHMESFVFIFEISLCTFINK